MGLLSPLEPTLDGRTEHTQMLCNFREPIGFVDQLVLETPPLKQQRQARLNPRRDGTRAGRIQERLRLLHGIGQTEPVVDQAPRGIPSTIRVQDNE